MPQLLLELFSEEIPARMQGNAARDLERMARDGLAKAGLISYTKSLAIEYGRDGVRANIVLPGTVKTPAWEARVQRNPQVFEQLRKWYPLDDFATPDDVAQAALFLCSPAARIITGVALPVDGGLLAGNRVMAQELTLETFY